MIRQQKKTSEYMMRKKHGLLCMMTGAIFSRGEKPSKKLRKYTKATMLVSEIVKKEMKDENV